MPNAPDNPDRDFSADPIEQLDNETLRQLLKRSEVADMSDDAVRRRIGEEIARAALNRKRGRR